MEQRVTIKVGHFKDRILPEDVAAAMQSVAPTLRSIDAKMWSVKQPRYEWCIDSATKQSPLTITLLAIVLNADAQQANVAEKFIAGYHFLETNSNKAPPYWDMKDVERVREWREVLSRGARVEIGVGNDTVQVSAQIVKNAERLIDLGVPQELPPQERYAGLRGRIRQITVDPDDKDGVKRHQFQLIDSETGEFVTCVFDAARAKEVHCTDELIAYGVIHANENGPFRIVVEDFRVIPDRIPTLKELQDLDMDITGGEDAATFVNRLRGKSD